MQYFSFSRWDNHTQPLHRTHVQKKTDMMVLYSLCVQANVRRMFPGLGIGTVAFVIAVAIEKKMKPASDHH